MNLLISSITKLITNKIVAFQSFLFERPRIDIDLYEISYGKNSLNVSIKQQHISKVSTNLVVYDFELFWKYKLRIKNNSSKTAYNIKIEKIFVGTNDYLQKIDKIVSLKEGELIELDYILKDYVSKNGEEINNYINYFPRHLTQFEILVSYANESRKVFYTKFIATKISKTNEHLIRKPK